MLGGFLGRLFSLEPGRLTVPASPCVRCRAHRFQDLDNPMSPARARDRDGLPALHTCFIDGQHSRLRLGNLGLQHPSSLRTLGPVRADGLLRQGCFRFFTGSQCRTALRRAFLHPDSHGPFCEASSEKQVLCLTAPRCARAPPWQTRIRNVTHCSRIAFALPLRHVQRWTLLRPCSGVPLCCQDAHLYASCLWPADIGNSGTLSNLYAQAGRFCGADLTRET